MALRQALDIATRTTAGGVLTPIVMMVPGPDDDDSEAEADAGWEEEESGDEDILVAGNVEVQAAAVAGGSGSTTAATPDKGAQEGEPVAGVTQGEMASLNPFKSSLSEESDEPNDAAQLPVYSKVDFTVSVR